jgi:hypothetical protein
VLVPVAPAEGVGDTVVLAACIALATPAALVTALNWLPNETWSFCDDEAGSGTSLAWVM